MDIKELREKTDKELDKALSDARNRLRELRFKEAAKQLSDVREIRETRKGIAQMLTLMAERRQPQAADSGQDGSAPDKSAPESDQPKKALAKAGTAKESASAEDKSAVADRQAK